MNFKKKFYRPLFTYLLTYLPKLRRSLLNPDLAASLLSTRIEKRLIIIPRLPTTVTKTPLIPNLRLSFKASWPLKHEKFAPVSISSKSCLK